VDSSSRLTVYSRRPLPQDFNKKIVKKTKKKESIFATSEAGKVGVTGSGKGMTGFHTREKYDKMKKASQGEDDDE
jgi:hypothetical protein